MTWYFIPGVGKMFVRAGVNSAGQTVTIYSRQELSDDAFQVHLEDDAEFHSPQELERLRKRVAEPRGLTAVLRRHTGVSHESYAVFLVDDHGEAAAFTLADPQCLGGITVVGQGLVLVDDLTDSAEVRLAINGWMKNVFGSDAVCTIMSIQWGVKELV